MLNNSNKFYDKKYVVEHYDEEWQMVQRIDHLKRDVSLVLDECTKNLCGQFVAIVSSIVGKILLQNLQPEDLIEYENYVQYFFEVMKNFGVKFFCYSSVLMSIWFLIKWLDDFLYARRITREISNLEKSMLTEINNYELDSEFKFDKDLFREIIQENEEEFELKLTRFLK